MSFYKRLVKRLLPVTLFIIFIIFLQLMLGGCNYDKGKYWRNIAKSNKLEYREGFSVHFLDVGEGDSIFINLPDGKNMLIDCASKNIDIADYIIDSLKAYSVETINFLLLTHLDEDHIGNASEVISNFDIEKALIPQVNFLNSYPIFQKIKNQLNDINCQQVISSIGINLCGKDYCICILSPSALGVHDSAYTDFNDFESSTGEESNNISPIVYVEYKGVSFIFTGDAGISQEKLILEKFNSHFYKHVYPNCNISLRQVDFLKVGHHGSDSSSSMEFLEFLNPKNAVISVGGDNYYGHPSSTVIDNIYTANKNVNLFRTDINGTISVFVDENGNYTIQTHDK